MNILYSAIYGEGYPFLSLTDSGKLTPVTHPAEMLSFDSALVIWGGADISPELYGHAMSRRCAPYAGRRDTVEWNLLNEAIDMDIPIIGVCRGAQMLCAAAGGYLLQDVNNHAGGKHNVTTFDGKTLEVNSFHHQMMVPIGDDGKPVEHELIAWSEHNVGGPYIYRDDKTFDPTNYGYSTEPLSPRPLWREPEFIYFPKINGYAVQWHPEWMDDKGPTTQYVLDFIRNKERERSRVVTIEGAST